MDAGLVSTLQREEMHILGELRGTMTYRRLEEIRRLLSLYDSQPPVGAALDEMLGQDMAPPRPQAGNVIILGSMERTAEVA